MADRDPVPLMADEANRPPRPPHPPLGRDKRGWQVSPAPDGRGAPPTQSRAPHRSRWFLWFVLGLLALNWLSLLLAAPSGQPRVTIPFSHFPRRPAAPARSARSAPPATRSQGISSTSSVIRSLRRHATTLFATQVPAFWSGSQLTAELEARNVEIKASASGQSVLVELLLGFGPTILFVGLLIWWLSRDVACRRRDGCARRIRALARTAGRLKASPSRSPTWRASTRQRPSCRRSSTSCATRRATRASVGGCRTACCSRGRPGPARHCSRAPSRARRTPRSSRSRRRSSSRRSSASGRRACATCSRRRARRSPRSSSSTSSTRSADHARDRSR